MILTNPFYPDPRPLKEAKLLVKNNFEVTIIAWNRGNDKKYKKIEYCDKIKIIRINSFGKYGIGIKSLISFAYFYLRVALISLRIDKQDVIYGHDIDTIIPLLIVTKIHKAKMVIDLHELYEEMFFKKSKIAKNYAKQVIIRIKKRFYNKIDLIVYADNEIKKYDQNRINNIISNYIIINNYPEKQIIEKIIKEANHKRDKTINISFYGNVREFDILYKITKIIEKYNGRFKLWIAGSGPDADKLAQIVKNYKYTKYLGSFKYYQLSSLYKNIDIVLCVYSNDKNSEIAFPVKFYEAYQIGIPVITKRNTRLGKYCEKYDIAYLLSEVIDFEKLIEKITNDDINRIKKRIYSRQQKKQYYFEMQEEKYINKITKLVM